MLLALSLLISRVRGPWRRMLRVDSSFWHRHHFLSPAVGSNCSSGWFFNRRLGHFFWNLSWNSLLPTGGRLRNFWNLLRFTHWGFGDLWRLGSWFRLLWWSLYNGASGHRYFDHWQFFIVISKFTVEIIIIYIIKQGDPLGLSQVEFGRDKISEVLVVERNGSDVSMRLVEFANGRPHLLAE